MKLSIFGVLMILAVGSAQKIRYDNYKVFSVVIEDDTQLQVMQDLQNAQGVIFWEAPEYVKTKVHVAIPPQQIEHFEDVVGNANVLSKLEIENLQDLIDEESPKINERSAKNVEDFNWTAYHDVDEIYAWLDHIAAQYPDKVTITDIGNTYEGRKMKVVKISFQEGNRGVFIEANIHAREWITSATSTFLINELLTSNDPNIMNIAQNVDWYILPMANPDGFQHTRAVDRMWRSTRSKEHSVICSGADANRNYAYHWMAGGASQVKCSYTYAGPYALSEIETQNTDNFLKEHASKMDVFLAFHSYSQLILLPYGDGSKPDNYEDQNQIAIASAEWIARRYSTQYSVGNSREILYQTSGTTSDYVQGVYGIPVSYTLEMRPLGGNPGFLLPPAQIIPNAEEVVDGMIGLVFRARDFGHLTVPSKK